MVEYATYVLGSDPSLGNPPLGGNSATLVTVQWTGPFGTDIPIRAATYDIYNIINLIEALIRIHTNSIFFSYKLIYISILDEFHKIRDLKDIICLAYI
jgi:hypothetical protein